MLECFAEHACTSWPHNVTFKSDKSLEMRISDNTGAMRLLFAAHPTPIYTQGGIKGVYNKVCVSVDW